jgi:hypothetical protein
MHTCKPCISGARPLGGCTLPAAAMSCAQHATACTSSIRQRIRQHGISQHTSACTARYSLHVQHPSAHTSAWHKSAYVSMRQHTSASSAYVSIRQHTSPARPRRRRVDPPSIHPHASASTRIHQHTSAYASIRQHTSASTRIHQHTSAYASIRKREHT